MVFARQTYVITILIGKKIKRRLEDLERRAGSSSASPEQHHAELPTQPQPRQKTENGVKRQKSGNGPNRQPRQSSPDFSSSSYSSVKDHRSNNHRSNMFFQQNSREASASPPPLDYSCQPPEPIIHAPYPQHAPFNNSMPGSFADYPGQPLYLPPLPATLPSMSSFEPNFLKGDSLFDDEDILGQFNMGYSPLTAMELSATQSYQDSNVHVNHPNYNFRFP